MDGDRKYTQRGYMDTNREGPRERFGDRPKTPPGPRPPLDITGPRLPRLLQTVTASRCYNCATMLAADTDFTGLCPKCHAPLHCCKQCAHFESSTRFQCLKPIPVRIAVKDKVNECGLFAPRVTVARDAAPTAAHAGESRAALDATPRTPNDARNAFDRLFKK